ncbi:hypothetical protein [Demetria terragena]|uniref:hypothetical protein n=1 Tax=Demetria terragena TaxID=63959 RepID=UPI001461348C|nr:hypothetical protein [Demetria terragena]
MPLIPVPQIAANLVEECTAELERGPDPLPQNAIDAARYAVTDLRADLVGAESAAERAVISAALWDAGARLLLDVDRCWQGTGKGLLRSLRERDRIAADGLASELISGLECSASDPDALRRAIDGVLSHAGGALFENYSVR